MRLETGRNRCPFPFETESYVCSEKPRPVPKHSWHFNGTGVFGDKA